MDAGDFEGAASHLRRAAEESPDEPERWVELATAEGLAERPERARIAWLEVARLRPHDPRPWAEVGYTHELERHYGRALVAYGHAVEAAPASAFAHRVRGTRLLRWGRPREALPDLERAASLDPDSARTWQALGLARHASGDVAGAERAFRAGLERRPADSRLLLGLAAILVNSHRFEAALRIYDGLRTPRRDGASVEVARALLLHELGRPREALAAFALAVRLDPERAELRRRLADYRELLAHPASGGPSAATVDPSGEARQAPPHDHD